MGPGSVYHLDCPSGLAGDMFLGACLDLGMPLEVLSAAVEALGLDGVSVERREARRGGLRGCRFRVLLGGRPIEGPDPDEEAGGEEAAPALPSTPSPHRDLPSIRRLIETSGLAAPVRERAVGFFVRLAEVEAKVHGVAPEAVHFHEVGALDSIVDLVGAAAAVEELAPMRLTSSPVVVGGGRVRTEHGVMAVPAPATAELLFGVPVEGAAEGELVTPTGALLLAGLVDRFQAMPRMVIAGTGYGLGRRELASRPNACRLLRGTPAEAVSPAEGPVVIVVECEIDDLSGEGFGFLLERLLDAGALDVFFTPVQMKKNRPGTLVTLLSREEDLERLAGLLLSESGSLGCRYSRAQRFEAERERIVVRTEHGDVRVKRARFGGRTIAESPEFEDCRRLALERGVTWREVYREALAALDRRELRP